MTRVRSLALMLTLAVPAVASAQSTGHQHQQGQHVQQMMMGQMAQMEQMVDQMARMHEQLRALQEHMSPMLQMNDTQRMQHQQMRGMIGAMTEMAGQMHVATTRMVDLARMVDTQGNAGMQRDLHELQTHMQRMIESMAASMELVKELYDEIAGGGGAR